MWIPPIFELCAQILFRLAYNILLPSYVISVTIQQWDYVTQSQQRLDVVMIVVCVLGPHNCLALIRAYMQQPAYEFETTTLLWIVQVYNYLAKDTSSEGLVDQEDEFQRVMRFLFNLTLICNTISYILFFIKRTIETQISELSKDGGGDYSEQRNLEGSIQQFRSAMESAVQLLMEFWSQFSDDKPDLLKLYDIGGRLFPLK